MTERETGFLGRYGRYVWGGAAALLLLVLAASLVLSGSSVSSAEAQAQTRAENLASSVVEEQLTSDLLTRDIDGTDYRDLTVRVQAGILSDDRFEVVRIWRIDAGLIYSTAQRDDVNSVTAGDDPWIRQALDGQTVSVISSNDTYHEGLKRPTEELYQTFIPIRLSSDTVEGVVQIDQRYSAIHNQAFAMWRPVQAVALLLLIGAGIMLARTFASGTTYGEGGVERRASPGRRADDLSVRDAVDRAERADRRVRETEKRVEELEAQLARAPSTATATAAVEELDLKLRASEAEREELASTVKRLQSELAEKAAEVALARDGSAGTRAEAKRVNKLIADAESKVVAAERKAAAAEQKSQDASKRASVSAERALELEAQLRESQKQAADAQKGAASDTERHAEKLLADAERTADERVRQAELNAERLVAETEARARGQIADAERQAQTLLAEAERRATAAEQQAAEANRLLADAQRRATDAESRVAEAGEGARRKEAGDHKISAELKRAEAERDQLMSKLDELEGALAEARERAERSEQELAVRNLELSASAEATASAESLQERATQAERKLADSEERVADAQSQLADALAKLRELEASRAALDEDKDDEPAPRVAFGASKELEARIAELENARRADVVELQRAQEAFANTQLELANATRKLREAEGRVKELERSGGKGGREPGRRNEAPPVPNYVSAADDPSAWGDAGTEDGFPEVPDTLPDDAWTDPVVEDPVEEPAEGLSLRERLARAAAARKRIS